LGSASASDTESLNNEPFLRNQPFVPPIFKNSKSEEQPILKRCSGRKKLRRYQNRCLLQTLAEEHEEEEDVVIIMEPYQGPFTRLLRDSAALHFWNIFVDKCEEEQAQLIAAFTEKNTKEKTVEKEKRSIKISPKMKRIFKLKNKLSLEQVKISEDDLIAFFKITPNGIYEKSPPTFFERLLLHTIAQYHGLQSLGIVENEHRKIEVYNTIADWMPVEPLLIDFAAYWRKC
jgi:hypothetical protein